jgi:NADPH:quinone reductase-like Zn-dependent oxidoreductase
VALTVVQAFAAVSRTAPRDKVLIHAGAGGVGTFAIQVVCVHPADNPSCCCSNFLICF